MMVNELNKEANEALITIATESWRLVSVFSRLLANTDVAAQSRYAGKIRWFEKKLEEALALANLKLVSFDGLQYDPGIPATAINIDEFSETDQTFVVQTIEPAIIGTDGRVIKSATILLGKAEQ